MALAFRTVTVRFDPTRGRVQNESGSANFGRAVRVASAAIKGFHVKYSNGDRQVWQETIDINNVTVVGQLVSFDVAFLLRDSSGNIDDPFEGFVEVLVIADVA